MKRIDRKIIELSHNPFTEGTIKIRVGIGYRLRVGDWRVIYTVNTKEQIVTVFDVCHRGKAYR